MKYERFQDGCWCAFPVWSLLISSFPYTFSSNIVNSPLSGPLNTTGRFLKYLLLPSIEVMLYANQKTKKWFI